MIKIYSMDSCPDCSYVKEQVKGNGNYLIADIGEDVRTLKEFLRLRDSSPVFDDARKTGAIGIPCFLFADGRLSLVPEDAGLHSRPEGQGTSCSIDGSGC